MKRVKNLLNPCYFGSPAYRAERLRQRIFSTRFGLKVAVAASRFSERHPNSKTGKFVAMATIPF